MLTVIRFIRGYLVICFSGEQGEKLLNVFADNSLNVWNMVYKKGKITGCIDIKSFKKLRKLKRGLNIRIKILQKRGLPFLVKDYKTHSGLLVGFAVFMLIIKLLSLHIWCIDVIGNENISREEIISECDKIGIKEGIKASKIDTKKDVIKLLLNNKNIAWASFNIEGSRLTVNLSETAKYTYENKLPVNIKAKRDGIITSISITGGEALIKTGDTVKKGDILISGVNNTLKSTVFTRAGGTVKAKTRREFNSFKPFESQITMLEDNTKSVRAISFLGVYFPIYIGKIGDKKIVKARSDNLTLSGQKLPCGIITVKYKETYKKTVKNSEEEIDLMLKNDIEKQIEKKDIKVLETISEERKTTNKGISLKKIVLCEETISEEDIILLDKLN